MLDNRNVRRTLLWDPLEPTATRPPGSLAGRFSLLLWHGLQQECDGSVRRAGRCRSGLRLLALWTGGFHGQSRPARPVVRRDARRRTRPVYYNYRYYNPRDGRWINCDPIAEQGGWNSYSFVGNNPIDSFDINGQNAMARAVPFAAGAAAVDGLLPIGDVIGAIVIVSAGAYDLSQPGPGTGNCTRLFHGMLQSAVNAAKIETALLGKCKDTDCCWLLKIKAATWLKNAIARDTINSKCYQGGDSGHRKASEQAWTNVINCQRKIKIKCNG